MPIDPNSDEALALNEADTRAEFIDPALRAAGWGVAEGSRVYREVIAPGRLKGSGRRGDGDIADYVLVYRGHKLAVVEAKRRGLPDTEGLGQAKRYAAKLRARLAMSTNGAGLYRVDMQTGDEGHIDAYPSPDELWPLNFGGEESAEQTWRERFGAVPFEDRGGHWQPRYYQHNAITATLEAIAQGRDRVLLTLATGTGKTAIAFQIAWKLFHSRWNLKAWRDGECNPRRPRVLFLADRNILADQAFNAFAAFPDDALVRIDPATIRKKGRVPKNGSLFFTIFQTFMSGEVDQEGNPQHHFGDYPPDFFDFIVIDECHRGGANDESAWRGILEYFAPAVQLGLTATPRRDDNADTYDYFGKPAYIYSLKEGINDGFLTPFKVRQIQTTLDEYVYTADDDVVEGEIEEGRRYVEEDFNRVIEIREREQKRVQIYMEAVNQAEKGIVFCATQEHALAIRDAINQTKTIKHPDYCVRVTANDGKAGENFLRTFQDNEKTIPTVLTTSRKLSTGVDAQNVRHIVLLRPIRSMIEFKQIIGRGTRLYEGKDYFTIWDFVKAYEHFNDPEWDGEPVAPEPSDVEIDVEIDEPDSGEPPAVRETPPTDAPVSRNSRVRVKLRDGKARQIDHMVCTTFWHPDGKPMSSQEFLELLFGELPEFFADEAELRTLWSDPQTRKRLLEGLEEKGFGAEQLAEMQRIIDAEKSDLYDVLGHVAFAMDPLTREERALRARVALQTAYNDRRRAFLEFVLGHYVDRGVEELDVEQLTPLLKLRYHDSIPDAINDLGATSEIRAAFVGFQQHLYSVAAAPIKE